MSAPAARSRRAPRDRAGPRRGSRRPQVLMIVARAFAQAELEPGEALQAAVVGAMEARAAPCRQGRDRRTSGAISTPWPRRSTTTFAIHAGLAATGAAFPADTAPPSPRHSPCPRRRVRSGLGFACAADPATSARRLVGPGAAAARTPVPSAMVERLCACAPGFRRRAGRTSTPRPASSVRGRAARAGSAAGDPRRHRLLV